MSMIYVSERLRAVKYEILYIVHEIISFKDEAVYQMNQLECKLLTRCLADFLID